jgi:hypothetical protein
MNINQLLGLSVDRHYVLGSNTLIIQTTDKRKFTFSPLVDCDRPIMLEYHDLDGLGLIESIEMVPVDYPHKVNQYIINGTYLIGWYAPANNYYTDFIELKEEASHD